MEVNNMRTIKFLIENNTDQPRILKLLDGFDLSDIVEEKFRCIFINDYGYLTAEEIASAVEEIIIDETTFYGSTAPIDRMKYKSKTKEDIFDILIDPYQTNNKGYSRKKLLEMGKKDCYFEIRVRPNSFLFITFWVKEMKFAKAK